MLEACWKGEVYCRQNEKVEGFPKHINYKSQNETKRCNGGELYKSADDGRIVVGSLHMRLSMSQSLGYASLKQRHVASGDCLRSRIRNKQLLPNEIESDHQPTQICPGTHTIELYCWWSRSTYAFWTTHEI